MNKKVNIISGFTKIESIKNISDVLMSIKQGAYKDQVELIRNKKRIGKEEEASKLKSALPAFTASGTFKYKRSNENIENYSSLIILDFDKLSDSQLHQLQKDLPKLQFVYSFFVSPSGNGLKIIVPVDSEVNQHHEAYEQVKQFFEEFTGTEVDSSGKDIARLCFVSYDPELYLNENCKQFLITGKGSKDFSHAFQRAKCIANIRFPYADGNRNNHIHLLACNCNRFGIPIKVAMQEVQSNYNLDKEEIERTIKGAYDRNSKQHGTKNAGTKVDYIEEALSSKYKFRYNEVTLQVEYCDIKSKSEEFFALNDFKENSILRWLLKSGIKVNQSLLRSILGSDFCNPYNPFESYFKNLPQYDGKVDYINELADRVQTHKQEFWRFCFKRWLVAMVACALTNKANHSVIVFSGKQGLGKTTWILNLIPEDLIKYVYSGFINPNNKDTLIHISECILVNLDELESLNKSEIGSLKEIITKDTIRVRKAYGRINENLIRRASFTGSVNTSQFLNDSTGSRRFLCFEVSQVDYTSKINYEQVYAQAIHLWKSGFKYWFDGNEINQITQNNEQFEITNTEEELLMTYYTPIEGTDAKLFLSTTEIINRICGKVNIANNSIRPRAMGMALKKNGFHKSKRNGRQVYAVHEKSVSELNEQFSKNP